MSGQLSASSHLESLNRSWDFSNSTQQNKYLLLMPSKAFTLNNSEAQDRSTVSLSQATSSKWKGTGSPHQADQRASASAMLTFTRNTAQQESTPTYMD